MAGIVDFRILLLLLLNYFLSLRYEGYAVDVSAGLVYSQSVVLCILTSCGFL